MPFSMPELERLREAIIEGLRTNNALLECEDETEQVIDQKDIREVKSSLKVIRGNNPVYIIALVVHNDISKNDSISISSSHGVPYKGYVHDHVNDCYIVNCIDKVELGYIDISFRVSMESTGWECDIPVPENIIKKYLSESQRNELKKLKTIYKKPDYYIQYLQMMSVY